MDFSAKISNLIAWYGPLPAKILKGMTLAQRIGVRIRVLRVERGLTQEKLAEAIGMAPTSISNIERGITLAPLNVLQRIGKVVGASLSELVDADHPDTARKADRERVQLETRLHAKGHTLSLRNLTILVGVAELLSDR
ncbi:MAG: helix-turn-helix domain-containing protein [Alphaproteobacteria bacterium]